MPFDGIGLDFLEGKRDTSTLIEYIWVSTGKDSLFAGLVNGKNIWKNHYEKTLKVLQTTDKIREIQAVLSTSCSLLHVPYTLKHEHRISTEYLAYFAFAEEKLRRTEGTQRPCRGSGLYERSCI